MNENAYFIQVLNGKGKTKNVYRIQTIWNNANNSFTITILDGCNAYQSSITKNILIEQSEKHEMNFEGYTNTIRLCLSQNNPKEFNYSIKENMFLISRIEKKFTVRFADFNLETIDFNIANANFIDELIKYNDYFRNQISIYKEEKDGAINDKNMYQDKLEHYVKEKQKMENDLYCKFILLLNEKKLRIQYLTELLAKYEQNQDLYETKTELKRKIDLLKTEKEMISDSESDSGDEKTTENIMHKVQIEVTPKKSYDFLDDDEDELPVQTLPKRSKICKNTGINNDEIKIDDTNNSSQQNSNLHDITVAAETQDALEFNTQDLFDRL